MKMDGATIAQATSGTLLRDAPAGRIHTDTRTLEAGDWFLAFRGEHFDGHRFVEQALDGAESVAAPAARDSAEGLQRT